jgi:hypothetical protein
VAVQSGAEAVEEGDGAEPRAEGLAGGGVRHDGHRGAEPPLDLVEEDPRQGGDGRGPVGEDAPQTLSIRRARERVKLPAYHVAHRLHHRPGTNLEDSDAPRRIARRDPSPSASGCTLSNATTGTVGIVTPDQRPSAASCHRLRTCGRPFYLFFVGPSPCRTCATRTQCDQRKPEPTSRRCGSAIRPS